MHLLLANNSAAGGGAAGAFEAIASITATGGESTLSFTSIPADYQHLQIRGIGRGSASLKSTLARIRFNSDTGSNYAQHTLQGNGSAVSTDTNTSSTYIEYALRIAGNNATANVFGAGIVDIHDYASTTKNKTIRAFIGVDGNEADTDFRVAIKSGLWIDTDAITSIEIFPSSGTWSAGTIYSLYGIKAA